MKQLQTLFKEGERIVLRDRTERNEKRKRGELFNIFDVLNLRTSEVRTHSAFLAELLNPNGNHGLGDRFLKVFISTIPELAEWQFDTEHAHVTVEDPSAGAINEDASAGGRMDITIKSHNQIIIIENKIYAGDQYKQLVRYANYAKRFKNWMIIYLTLFKQEASAESYTDDKGEKVPYVPMGYDNDIRRWLYRCQQIAVQHPLIRETIAQYINLIKVLTHQMENNEHKKELLEVMAQNADATAAIYGVSQVEYIAYLLENRVFPVLKSVAAELDLEFGYTDNLLSAVKEAGFYFYKREWHRAGIVFYTETNGWRDFYYGISNYEGTTKLDIQGKKKLECMTQDPTDYWPYGWARLDRYQDWNRTVMPDMANGKFANYIKEVLNTILHELKEKKINL